MPIRAAVGLAAVALLAPAAAQARAQETVVIKVHSVQAAQSMFTDKAPKGKLSDGDTLSMKDVLLNAQAQFGKKKGAQVGTDAGSLIFTSATTAVFKGTTQLPGGTITLDGQVTFRADGTIKAIPVTGGTGKFAGARGQVVVAPGPTEKLSLNTYTLKLTGLAA